MLVTIRLVDFREGGTLTLVPQTSRAKFRIHDFRGLLSTFSIQRAVFLVLLEIRTEYQRVKAQRQTRCATMTVMTINTLLKRVQIHFHRIEAH